MNRLHRGHFHPVVPALLLIITIMAVLMTHPLLAAQKAALITDLKGTVMVKNGDRTGNAHLLQRLAPGDILTSSDKSAKLTISMASDGSVVPLTGVFQIRVKEDGIYDGATSKKIKGKEVVSALNIKPHDIELAHAGAARTRVYTPGRVLCAFYPLYFKIVNETSSNASKDSYLSETILSQRPDFMWYTSEGDSHRFLYIRCTSDYKEKVRKLDIRQPGFARYNQNEKELTRGNFYAWWLSNDPTGSADVSGESEEFEFKVLSREEAEKFARLRKTADEIFQKDNSDISPYISLISIYLDKDNGLYSPALDLAYKIKDKLRPGDPIAADLPAMLYDKMKINDVIPAKKNGETSSGRENKNKKPVQQWEDLRKTHAKQDVTP
jgi:hypothetical protein